MKPRFGFGSRALAGLALAVLVVAVAARRNAISGLRRENADLLDGSSEAQRLVLENQEIPRLRAEQEEAQKLRQENEDLPRLRNEARQLRRDTGDLAKLRTENQRLLALPVAAGGSAPAAQRPDGFIAVDALADAGQGSPAAAVQTFFWALFHGDNKRVLQCLYRPPDDTDDQWTEDRVGRMFTVNSTDRPPGFAIVAQKQVSPDEVTVGLQSTTQGPGMMISARLVGGEWKVKLQ